MCYNYGALLWKEMKAVSAEVVSCCVNNKPKHATYLSFTFDY